MFTFGEDLFCRDVILDQFGSPTGFVNPFRGSLVLQIVGRDDRVIYRSNRRPVSAGVPPRPDQKIGVFSRLERVMFPEPGNYIVDIMFNDRIRRREALLLE